MQVQDAAQNTATAPLSIVVNKQGRITLAYYGFPDDSSWPPSGFVTTEEYGGITVTAPDLVHSEENPAPSNVGTYRGYWGGTIPNADEWVQFTYKGADVVAPGPPNGGPGYGGGVLLQLRYNPTTGSGYDAIIDTEPDAGGIGPYSALGVTDDAGNSLAYFFPGFGTLSVKQNDVFRFEVVGNVGSLYQNGVLLGQVTGGLAGQIGVIGTVIENFGEPDGSGGTVGTQFDFGDLSVGTFGAPYSIWLDKPLWFLGQGNAAPQGFSLGATTAALTLDGGGDGTYVWSVTNGASRINFENDSTTITKTNLNTVGVKAIGFSDLGNDVTVTLQYTPADGTGTTTFNYVLTIDSPYQLIPNGSPSHAAVGGMSCAIPAPDGTNGWQSLIPYNIVSRFGKLITNIDINESFGAWSDDYVGNTWEPPSPVPYRTPNGFFVDNMCVQGFTPPATIPQWPLGSVEIQHSTQSWFVGSTTSSSGVQVQSDVHQRFQDHGEHQSVVSPVR